MKQARALGVVVAMLAAGFARSVPQDDDLGSQPLTEPTPADLGVEPEPKADDDVPAETPTRRRRSVESQPVVQPSSSTPAVKTDKSIALSEQLLVALQDIDDADLKALIARVDAAAAIRIDDSAAVADPSLRLLSRLLKAKSALLSSRFDEADVALKDVSYGLDNVVALDARQVRSLREAVRYHRAALGEARVRARLFGDGCGRALGIKRIARDEAAERQQLLETVSARYAEAARGPDRFWARRAAFAAARLYEEVARRALAEPDYRAVSLPAPYAVDAVDTVALLEPVLVGWFGEIRRVYGEILAAIDARDPDPALAERVRARAAELARLELKPGPETVENPWRAELHPGLVRVGNRAERRDQTGHFVPVETRVAVETMNAAIAGTGVDAAYALAGLANLVPEMVPAQPILAALSSTDERLVVAGLIAAERVVRGKGGAEKAVALREAVTAAYAAGVAAQKASSSSSSSKAFSTVKGSLYGRVERGLLALLAIARVDRTAAELIVADARLPTIEQAWIAADITDARFAARYDTWAWDKDERLAALAVWGSVSGRGRRDAGYLLRPNDTGLVGCVSRHLTE